MPIKNTIQHQLRRQVNEAVASVSRHPVPPLGWLATVRKALGISGQVAMKRANISKAELYRIEKAEREGSLTLKTLRSIAHALGCELHYAVLPQHGVTVEQALYQQARQQAQAILAITDTHMKLENQATSVQEIERQVEELTQQLMAELPAWLWEPVRDHS
ncbi:helix-turn-helix domain-containing protein [Pseudidiomarina mangrovi]|uniref:helix-turn-helix domain-containing protein n=1 Tax=Pseudidiomarina mangrovi TaxID=2487133 RepID=UPI000FCC030E|nr:helix-turn-helix domain-containing protein [Pseudidiomarina mangrovi]